MRSLRPVLPEPQSRLWCHLRGICFACDICRVNLAMIVVGKRSTICAECLERNPEAAYRRKLNRILEACAYVKKMGYVKKMSYVKSSRAIWTNSKMGNGIGPANLTIVRLNRSWREKF
jgi:hypothetical protein